MLSEGDAVKESKEEDSDHISSLNYSLFSAGEIDAFKRLKKLTCQMDDNIYKLIRLGNNIRGNNHTLNN